MIREMQYTIVRLQTDVMALSGENPRQLESFGATSGIWTYDAHSLRIRALLPICGRTLLSEASRQLLGGGEEMTPQYTCKKMPCGLYAVDIELPATTVRIVSIYIPGWERDLSKLITPDSAEWNRQWSAEPCIAGCSSNPIAYIDASTGGIRLRAMSIDKPFAQEAEYDDENSGKPLVAVWKLPEVDEDDNFQFPEGIYMELVREIGKQIGVLN